MNGRPWEEEQGDVATETRQEVKRPSLYRVILLNDDYTTREFVVAILETIFDQPREIAYQIMMNVHNRGSGTAGVYPYETAEAKVAEVHALARESEFPLQCAIEPE